MVHLVTGLLIASYVFFVVFFVFSVALLPFRTLATTTVTQTVEIVVTK